MKKSDSGTATKQPTRLRELTEDLQRLEAKLRLGGGPDKIDRQHQQGKLTARERIERLLDKDAYVQEIGLLVADLEAAGVQVKDLDRGLVDFPARHPESGDLVLLCWHLGEDRVAFWHGLDEGFVGRKPLPF